MDNALNRFLDDLQKPGDLNTLRRSLSRRLEAMGFNHFSYHAIRPAQGPRLPLVITNYPKAWAQYYTEQDYVNIDSVVATATRSASPFTWKDLLNDRQTSVDQRRLFDEAGEFKILDGGTLPIHGPSGALAMMTAASSERPAEFAKIWEEHRYALRLIACYAHDAIVRAASLEEAPKFFHLSPRERECLLWAARGKTAWETSMVIGTSERTVIFHFENIMKKFAVHSKIHAVVKAIMLGLIVP